MKKVKGTEMRCFMWLLTIMFLVMMLEDDSTTVFDVFFIAAFLIYLWYRLITGIGYVEVGEGKLHVVTKCRKEGYRNGITIDEEFRVADIVRMGYTMDLYGHWIYVHRMKDPGYEIVFELNNGKRVFIDLGSCAYTKKQQREIFQYIYEIDGLKPEGKLRKDLKID